MRTFVEDFLPCITSEFAYLKQGQEWKCLRMVEEAAEQVAGTTTERLRGAAEYRFRHISKALTRLWRKYAVDPAHARP